MGTITSMRSFGFDTSVFKKKLKPGTAKRMLRFALPYAWLLTLLFCVVTVIAAIGVANPLIYRAIINNGILGGNSRTVIRLAILLGILGLLDSVLGLAQAYLSIRIGTRVVFNLRTELFQHIQEMPIAFFARTQTGALVSRLNTDVTGAQTAFTDILSSVVASIVTIILVLGAMFVLSWQITLAALILLPLFIIPGRFWGRRLQEITRESYDVTAAMNTLATERFNVAGAQLAKLFGRRQDEVRAFEASAARVCDIDTKKIIYARLFLATLVLMTVFATALAYGWGGVLAVKHQLDLGTVVAIVSYLTRLYGPLTGLSNVHVSVMTALVSFERVFEVLDLSPMIQERPNAIAVSRGPAQVSFDGVSFRYPLACEVSLGSLESVALPGEDAEKTVLSDISFVAEPGQLVALVGPSGSGKTTITHLISRLYDVQSGVISVNGTDIRELKLDTLHQRIGTVTQDAHLFHDTIRANLLYARPDASETDLIEALRAAQILLLVESLPRGLDTLVGERGYRFSGGEKQRLAIARLLLKSPEIVILDEATAHLDSASEAAIQQALDIALRGRTSIVIAHRLSTILKADQILVLQEGCIIEQGTHASLLKQGGAYEGLYRRQFADSGNYL